VATQRRPTPEQARAAWDELAELGAAVSVADLQQRWNITQQRVQQLVALDGFPQPISGGYGSLWLAADVEDWRRRHNERPSKPGPRPQSLPAPSAKQDAAAERTAWAIVERSGGLVTIADLADLWGIGERAARDRTKQHAFPAPASTGRWLRAEVESMPRHG
jgi:predicted DNA-binding transcriptional regulator AlpA